MAFPQSPILVRLQELKLWQGNYDSMLQNQKQQSECDYNEGVSPLDTTNPHTDAEYSDRKIVSPAKPFEQLLEEKLAEYKPTDVEPKPKQPYLRKGQGLARFKLKTSTASNSSVASRKSTTKTKIRRFTVENHGDNVPTKDIFSPLKIPDDVIQPKGIWLDAVNSDKENIKKFEVSLKKLKSNREALKESADSFNSEIMNKMNEYENLRNFLPNFNKDYASSIEQSPSKSSSHPGEQTLYEQQVEKELRIFEMLEQKAENSSFCSTNTSVVNLLSSTPNKGKKVVLKETIEEEKVVPDTSPSRRSGLNLQEKLSEVNQKTSLLQNFLISLKKASSNRKNSAGSESELSDAPVFSLNNNFSDEDRWSSTLSSPALSPSASSYSTMKHKLRKLRQVEIGVNTSFDNEETFKNEKCENCDMLEEKLKSISKSIPNVQLEKTKLLELVKDLEYSQEKLQREVRSIKKKHEQEVKLLNEELDKERKKYKREKTYFETYVKEAQNRPSKKEREEISNLKRELTDIKELIKLKETKNGATQCRLRNQIKFLEKENSDLKTDVEKLQKENAKLVANRMLNRRPSETKMLQEINKNLTKLTEETLKKQTSMSDKNIGDECNTAKEKSKIEVRKSLERFTKENVEPKEAILFVKNSQRNRENSTSNDSSNFDIPDMSIEKQYESVFGHFESPKGNLSNSSINEKTETVFEDGSMVIKYSNGNEKMISPDGSIVRIKYFNGDIKETNTKDKTIRYFYLENSTWHTQFGDGLEIIEYPDGQRSKKYTDGKIEVTYPDGTYRFINADGSEEAQYPDGSKTVKNVDGEVTIHLPNGQREVHTKTHKRREYPDGTVRTLYEDGRIETRYSNGRIRIKDANNVLVMDTHEGVAT